MGLWAAWNRRKRSEIAEKRSSRETSIHVDSTSMLSEEQISPLPPFFKRHFALAKIHWKELEKATLQGKCILQYFQKYTFSNFKLSGNYPFTQIYWTKQLKQFKKYLRREQCLLKQIISQPSSHMKQYCPPKTFLEEALWISWQSLKHLYY